MQTILGLIENAAGGPFHHTSTDLFAAVGRKAVETMARESASANSSSFETEPLERLFPFSLLLLLAHGGPDIGVESLSTTGSFHRITGDRDLLHRLTARERACSTHLARARIRPDSRCARSRRASATEHQRMGHVVAITHIGERLTAQIAEGFLHGEEVR